MAEAYGKLTGRPGVCIVTRGPGATHASVGVHTAFQDSTPLLLLVGQVASDQEEREAFQEIDYRRMFGPMAKWVAQIDRTDRIPEYVARAYATACSGRPGPVVLALPEDMLARESDAADALPYRAVQAAPGRGQTSRSCATCSRGRAAAGDRRRRRLDGEGDRPTSRRSSRQNAIPAGAAFRRQDALDNDSPELRRRRRHRDQPGARGTGEGGRRAARRRAAPRRDDDLRLHAARAADAPPDAGARPSGRRGARARLPAGTADPGRAGGVRRSRARPPRRAALARVDGRRRAPTTRPGRCTGRCRARSISASASPISGERLPDAIVTNGAGQLLRLGAPLLALACLPHPARAHERRDGLRRPGRRRREEPSTPAARSSASPATATSS